MKELIYTGHVDHKWNSKLCRDYYIYDLKDGSNILTLTQCRYTRFDSDAFNTVIEHDWRFLGSRSEMYGYAATGTSKNITMLHQILAPTEDMLITVDHISRNSLDNRRANLRLATKTQQNLNRVLVRSGESCAYRGVMLRNDRNLYRVFGRDINKKKVNIGHFKDPIQAAYCWDEWMYDTFKNDDPLSGLEINGIHSEPTLNFINFNFPERLGLK